MDESIFIRYPEIERFIEETHRHFGVPRSDLEPMIILVGELRYRDGYFEGCKFVLRELGLMPPPTG